MKVNRINKELHRPVIRPGEAYERLVIWVDPAFLARQSTGGFNLSMCFELISKKSHNLIRPNPEALGVLKGILSKFEKACVSTGFGNSILKNVYLTELVVCLNKIYLESMDDTPETDIEFNEKIDRIVRFINSNLHTGLSLDSLSSRFFLSKYHLLREFKKHTGYTIHQFIHRKRLITAKSLLREGMPVSEVCERCGFGDYSNFIRSFKKAFGLPPKSYSKSMNK